MNGIADAIIIVLLAVIFYELMSIRRILEDAVYEEEGDPDEPKSEPKVVSLEERKAA